MPTLPTIVWIVALLIVAAVGIFAGYLYRKKVAEKEIGSAEDEAKRIINEAIKSAEAKKRESVVEAREEIFRARAENERECKERRAEGAHQSRDLGADDVASDLHLKGAQDRVVEEGAALDHQLAPQLLGGACADDLVDCVLDDRKG